MSHWCRRTRWRHWTRDNQTQLVPVDNYRYVSVSETVIKPVSQGACLAVRARLGLRGRQTYQTDQVWIHGRIIFFSAFKGCAGSAHPLSLSLPPSLSAASVCCVSPHTAFLGLYGERGGRERKKKRKPPETEVAGARCDLPPDSTKRDDRVATRKQCVEALLSPFPPDSPQQWIEGTTHARVSSRLRYRGAGQNRTKNTSLGLPQALDSQRERVRERE